MPVILQRPIGMPVILQRPIGMPVILQRPIGMPVILQRPIGVQNLFCVRPIFVQIYFAKAKIDNVPFF
jgi:hypothetical protein